MSSSDLSDYVSESESEYEHRVKYIEEEQEEEEEEEEEEDNTPIVVKEVVSSQPGWEYLYNSNSYIFKGIDNLIDIINHHGGNVDVLLLHNSLIKNKAIFAARLHRIKSLSIYTPVQIFTVYPDQ